MIVRINQFDIAHAEQYAGWAAAEGQGPILAAFPGDSYAFEILILEADEQNQALPRSFRQTQLRQLIPEILAALREEGEEIVVRLDGPVNEPEMQAALKYLTDTGGQGRFAISAVQKLESAPMAAPMNVRVAPSAAQLTSLCADPAVGLDKTVRMRAFLVPEALVNPLLDMNDLDDERWSEVLAAAGCVVGTVRSLQSLHLITRRFDPSATRQRLMQRLVRAQSPAV